jgi:hypothetical protein
MSWIKENTQRIVAERIEREEHLIYAYFGRMLGKYPTEEKIKAIVEDHPDLFIMVNAALPYGGVEPVFFGTREEARLAGWDV